MTINTLLVIGSNSHVLSGFYPAKQYQNIILADRSLSKNNNFKGTHLINYDLLSPNDSDKEIIDCLYSIQPQSLDILFSSYSSIGLKHTDDLFAITNSLGANIARPLRLLSIISEDFGHTNISGLFISSMYAKVSPNPSNYKSDRDVNPLFYGASKAAVEQGIKWLSSRNTLHRFNSISLGAMPKNDVIKEQPDLVKNLLKSIPSNKFVSPEELNLTINYILDSKCNNLRGSSIILDGGYTIW